MKKGMLFTLMTFFVLFSLLLFAQSMFLQDLERQNIRISMPSSAKASATEEFIGKDILYIFNVSEAHLNKSASKNSTVLYFSKFGAMPMKNSSEMLARYTSFIQNNYSKLDGANISIFNATPTLFISGYNTTITLNQTETLIITENPNLIQSITITILTNTSTFWNSSSPAQDTNSQNITVFIRSSQGTAVFSSSATLNPNKTNAAFTVFFNQSGLSSIQVEFGNISNRTGTFRIRANNIAATPQDLKIAYSLISSPVQLRIPAILRYADLTLGKNSSIILRTV